jgi:DNA-binding response OmpR family regulator
VSTANNGRLALSVALRERPDVLVADLDLPGLSGREVAGLLKRMHQSAAPALVFMDTDGHVAGEIPGLGQVLPRTASVAEVLEAVRLALPVTG